MSTNTDTQMNQLSEAAREIAQRASQAAQETAKRATATGLAGVVEDAAGDVTNATKDAAKRATDTARALWQSAARKVGGSLESSREFVRRNPLPVVLGAIVLGAALGTLLMMARRKPTFSEQYVDEPMDAVREAILGGLAPVAHRVHEGYDAARDGLESALDRVRSSGHNGNSLTHHIGRIGNNLKFW